MVSFKKVVEQASQQAAIDANPPECEHQRSEVRSRTIRGGSTQFVRQCLDCGEPLGNPLKQSGTAKPFDDALREKWMQWRESVREQARENERQAWWGNYRQYMQSPEWFALREKVLKRDAHTCRGCLEREATEVHHASYKHFGAEFAFELISLCRECHQRYHADDADE